MEVLLEGKDAFNQQDRQQTSVRMVINETLNSGFKQFRHLKLP